MISKDTIKKLASLARLEVTDAEVETLAREAGSILNYAESLNTLDVAEVTPMTHAELLENVIRDDVAIPTDEAERNRMMSQLAKAKDDQLQVPNVFGNV
ncbi:MAG: Asp-tRNA(Asn)/Glu-tRNA(Gln) amidotransferase subunit GatC [Patescibacteria group bacterium]